jgi:hypothetical protein
MTPRQEQDREDLLREATAMVERAELRASFWPETIFVGFRRDGSLSIYFGGDPVYQFNTKGQLRRAFIDGLLYKADRGRLSQLRRERTETATALIRHDLSETESSALMLKLHNLLGQLRTVIEQSGNGQARAGRLLELVGAVPTGANVISRVHDWLIHHAGQIQIAVSPRSI